MNRVLDVDVLVVASANNNADGKHEAALLAIRNTTSAVGNTITLRNPASEASPDVEDSLSIISESGSSMAIKLDAVTLDIMQYSPGFISRFGPCSVRTSFEDWLRPGDPVLEVYEEHINAFTSSGEATCFFNIAPLTLQLPGDGHGCVVELRLGISFTVWWEDAEGVGRVLANAELLGMT